MLKEEGKICTRKEKLSKYTTLLCSKQCSHSRYNVKYSLLFNEKK